MVSSPSSSFFRVCALKRDQTYFFAFLGAREARSAKRAEEQQTRATGGKALHAPRACLSSPEKREKITSVIQAKLKPVIETSPSSRPSHFLGTRLRDPQEWY